MSEKINNEDVLCGAIYENGEYVPVYCNRVTGECYFADPVMSYNRLISELSVDDPIEVDFPDTVEAIVSGSFGECLGIIYNGERLVKLLGDETATDIPVDEPLRVGDTFAIDIYGDYDEE